jgi:hypothetical protein
VRRELFWELTTDGSDAVVEMVYDLVVMGKKCEA